MRLIIAAAILTLAACGGPEPLKSDVPSIEASAPKPTAMPAEAGALPAADARIGALNLQCGGDTLRVAFLDTHATVVNDNGGNTDLPRLPADADTAPGVSVFTDGKVTFTKQGGGDTPTVIKFARGKTAFQDCAIAQN